MVGLVESYVVLRIDLEIARIYVVPLQHHLKHLWLVN